MPDTLALDLCGCDCCDAMVPRDEIGRVVAYGIETFACARCRGETPDTAADAIEDARRWLDRDARCERRGCMWNHCMSEAEAAIERAGLIVVGEIGHLFEGGGP